MAGDTKEICFVEMSSLLGWLGAVRSTLQQNASVLGTERARIEGIADECDYFMLRLKRAIDRLEAEKSNSASPPEGN